MDENPRWSSFFLALGQRQHCLEAGNTPDAEREATLIKLGTNLLHPEDPERVTGILLRAERSIDFDQSVSLCLEAMQLARKGHRHRRTVIAKLSDHLLARFKTKRDVRDLVEHAALRQQILDESSPTAGRLQASESSRFDDLVNLSDALFALYTETKEPEHFRQSLQRLQEGLDSLPESHPRRTACQTQLAHRLLRCKPEVEQVTDDVSVLEWESIVCTVLGWDCEEYVVILKLHPAYMELKFLLL